MAHLILVRHTKSEWNKLGLWTGWTDVSLAEEGRVQAKTTAENVRDLVIDHAYTSTLKRVKETWDIVQKTLGWDIPTSENAALNERHYGIYTGKNKWEIQKQVGEEEFKKIRRSWNHPIPEGETLEDVYNRIVPFYEKEILPQLMMGKNVALIASGNSLRALVKRLEQLSEEDVLDLEFGIGEVYVYDIDPRGTIVGKKILAANPEARRI
jgi:2,3-bisphosphoglycerate-dependent phosphoglycerate mutase